MCTRVTVLNLCVCVCPPFSGSIKHLFNTLIAEIGFVINTINFQHTNFSEKASFKSYSVFRSFSRHGGHFVARCNVNQRRYKVIKIPRDFLSIKYIQAHHSSGKVGVPQHLFFQWRDCQGLSSFNDLIWIVVHNEPSFVWRIRGFDVEKLASFFYAKSMANKCWYSILTAHVMLSHLLWT